MGDGDEVLNMRVLKHLHVVATRWVCLLLGCKSLLQMSFSPSRLMMLARMTATDILAINNCSLLTFRSYYDSIMLCHVTDHSSSQWAWYGQEVMKEKSRGITFLLTYWCASIFIFLFELLCLAASPIDLFFRLHHQGIEILVIPLTIPSTICWW
jgi:hypothetical protein